MPLKLESLPAADGWAQHSAISDPGQYAALIDVIAPQPSAIGEVARNVIAHYRAQAEQLPTQTRSDINLRWLERQLQTDQQRHGVALSVEREVGERLQGCCRDHTLFGVAVLRQHGIPARSRVGFARYLSENWNYDHVIVEFWAGDRWVRFDPEVAPESGLLADPLDIAAGPDSPFPTAAETLMLMRSGDIDPATYGVSPGFTLSGSTFITNEVFFELAHRYGDEVLLWDAWGALAAPDEPITPEVSSLANEIATMLIAADAGDVDSERALYERYTSDPMLSPGEAVVQFSPFGDPPVKVNL